MALMLPTCWIQMIHGFRDGGQSHWYHWERHQHHPDPDHHFRPLNGSGASTLSVIGAGMALGWSRRLRRRVKQAGKYRL